MHACLVAEGSAILAVLQHVCCGLLPSPRGLLQLLNRSPICAAALQECRRPPPQHLPTAVACSMRAAVSILTTAPRSAARSVSESCLSARQCTRRCSGSGQHL